MSVKATPVGSDEILNTILADPISAAARSSVLTSIDARNLSGLYALVAQHTPLLLNSAGTFDRARSALGTTGILAVNHEGSKSTFRAVARALATVTGATDVFQIGGSATKTIRVTKVTYSGTIATAAQYLDVALIKRGAVDTGGTSSAPDSIPVDSSGAAATAALLQFTANPTLGAVVGTTGLVAARRYFAALTGTPALMSQPAEFKFGELPGAMELVLRGVVEALCLNLNAPSNAGTADIEVEWTEEPN